MKPILILKTGELPRRVIENLGPYEHAFLQVVGEERCVVVDARKEEVLDAKWAGIIITGSPASTYDGDAWITRSEEFLKRAADRSIPLYGVCFGHQLLAQTFGGKGREMSTWMGVRNSYRHTDRARETQILCSPQFRNSLSPR